MRNPVLGMLLLAGLASATVVRAQTWDHPWWFSSDPYSTFADTCDQPSQMLYLDGGYYPIEAPAHVYRVVQIFNLWKPSPLYPWYVHVRAYSPYGLDLSVWVCQTKSGDVVDGCVDAADNGPGQWNDVTVPAKWGTYYVIVTGNIDNQYPTCGAYELTASY